MNNPGSYLVVESHLQGNNQFERSILILLSLRLEITERETHPLSLEKIHQFLRSQELSESKSQKLTSKMLLIKLQKELSCSYSFEYSFHKNFLYRV